MKFLIASILMIATMSAFAGQATKAQVKFLCETVDLYIAEEANVDAAVDLKRCIKINATMTAKRNMGGVSLLQGQIPFNTPNGRVSKKCTLPLIGGVAKLDNVIVEAFTCK